MMNACMSQFNQSVFGYAAAASAAQSCSAAVCTNEAAACAAQSKKDALAVSFFVVVSIIALMMLLALRLCRLHAILGLLISLLVRIKWSLAEVHWMQLHA